MAGCDRQVWLQLSKAYVIKEESTMSYADCLAQVTVVLSQPPPASAEASPNSDRVLASDLMATGAQRLRQTIREIRNVRGARPRWAVRLRAAQRLMGPRHVMRLCRGSHTGRRPHLSV